VIRRRRDYLFFIVAGCLAWVQTAHAAGWYVDKNANGSNSGTSLSNAWQTFGAINWSSVAAGDTIWVAGGQYAETLQVGSSGQVGSPINIRNYNGEDVRIVNVPMGIRIYDRSHVSIRGISCVGTGEYVDIKRSHHIEIARGEFIDSTRKSDWPVGFRLTHDTHHCWVHHNTIGGVGYATDEDHGGVINIGRWEDNSDHSHYNLIENNVLFHGGHHIMEISSSYNVIRNNYWHNEKWMSYSGNQFGNRHLGTDGPGNNAGSNLIEGNIFATCAPPPDGAGVSGVSLRSQRNIVRRNVFYDNDMAGLNLSSPGYHVTGYDPPGNVRNNHIYHNVMFHNGYAENVTDTGLLGGISFLQYGASDEIEQTYVKNNIMWSNNNAAIAFESSSRSLQIIENNWEETGDPLFVNDEGPMIPGQPELLDFHLQENSPCIDNGGYLTQTVSAGSGTQIPVVDAAYFMDGYGIEQMTGDAIQFEGQGTVATIVSIDYVANRLTVDRAMSWRAGLGVAQPYQGMAPDQGAYEHPAGSVGRPSPPVNLRIVE